MLRKGREARFKRSCLEGPKWVLQDFKLCSSQTARWVGGPSAWRVGRVRVWLHCTTLERLRHRPTCVSLPTRPASGASRALGLPSTLQPISPHQAIIPGITVGFQSVHGPSLYLSFNCNLSVPRPGL